MSHPHPVSFAAVALASLLAGQAAAPPARAVEPSTDAVFDRAEPTRRWPAEFQLPGGAAWDGRGSLFVPDLRSGKLLSLSLRAPDQPPRLRLEGEWAISSTCFQNGRLYLADRFKRRVAVLENSGSPRTLASWPAKDAVPNDLVVDVNGTSYVTFPEQGLVRRIDAGGQTEVFIEGLGHPRGVALSPDGSTLYVSTRSGTVFRIGVDGSTPPDAERFAEVPAAGADLPGVALTVDRAGNLYVAGSESVTVFDPSGKPLDELALPHRPIKLALGGIDARSLYVSTRGGLYEARVRQYAVSPNPVRGEPGSPDSTVVPETIEAELNRVYAKVGTRSLLMDWFRPRDRERGEPLPAIVLVHGGGWLKGDKTKFRALALRLAERGYGVAAIEYRLGFEAPFPAAIRDCNAATAYLRAHAQQLGIDPQRVAAVGGSAGGHLVGLMASGAGIAELRHAELFKGVSTRPDAAVVMAGPLQIASGRVAQRSHDRRQPSNAVNWIGATIDEEPGTYRLADAYEKIDAATPPMLFLCGSLDQPERNEPARRRLVERGAPTELAVHEGAAHGHWNRAEWIPTVVDDIVGFLQRHL